MARSRLVGVLVRVLPPVAGVALFGWDAWTIILLYWIETWFIGADAFVRMSIAEGRPERSSSAAPTTPPSRGCLLGMFVLQFGMLLWFTGMLVLVAVPLMLGGGSIAAPLAFSVAVVVSALVQGWEHRRFMSSDAYLWVTPMSQARAPVSRLLVIVLTVTAGTFIGALVPFVPRSLVVIVCKTVGDVMAEYEIGWFTPEAPTVSGTPESPRPA